MEKSKQKNRYSRSEQNPAKGTGRKGWRREEKRRTQRKETERGEEERRRKGDRTLRRDGRQKEDIFKGIHLAKELCREPVVGVPINILVGMFPSYTLAGIQILS